MTLPALSLALVCALLLAALFHVVVNGGPGRLVLYAFLSVAGFAAGNWIGSRLHWVFVPIGTLNVGAGALGSLLFLGAGYWLSLTAPQAADHSDPV